MHLTIMLENREELIAFKIYYGELINDEILNNKGDSIIDLLNVKP
jgi:hypothetical protein